MSRYLMSLVKLGIFMLLAQVFLNHLAVSLTPEGAERKLSCEKVAGMYWTHNGCQLLQQPY